MKMDAYIRTTKAGQSRMRNWIILCLHELKEEQNRKKTPFVSSNYLMTGDFRFSKFENNGDSGNMMIAKRKGFPKEKYFVKHYYSDCACNEFMYAAIAEQLGILTPRVKLFMVSENEKRNLFYSGYGVGIEAIEKIHSQLFEKDVQKDPSIQKSRIRACALDQILDGWVETQFLMSKDHQCYRFDLTESFNAHYDFISILGMNENLIIQGKNRDEILQGELERHLNSLKDKSIEYLKRGLTVYNNSYSDNFTDEWNNTYAAFLNMDDKKIQNAIDILCYIYPDELGTYYQNYIKISKEKIRQYFTENK